MWQRACFLTRLVSSSVRISEKAGDIIKGIMSSGELNEVDKGKDGKVDLQTEADRRAQYCIVKSLEQKFTNRLKVIGEEEITSEAPLELSLSPEVLKIDDQCPEVLRSIKEEDVVVWVDPLDGTSEFAQAAKTKSPLLSQVTVLIGISYKGEAVAGVIHQPYYEGKGRTIWGIVGVGTYGIEIAPADDKRVVVTTRSHPTPLVNSVLDTLKSQGLLTEVDRVGGAGYKVLRCLEGAAAYVFASAGCKKWDTAAPEAILKATGGHLTDISGRTLCYNADVQRLNSGGVLATAFWVNHQEYVNAIPEEAKSALPEFSPKK
uniref:3'(2'),5'-bisphosphate nucleotidase 1 n=1 Tax=Acrobeloides nanus TaxID=290746 RepID=A0A914D353_9BILA